DASSLTISSGKVALATAIALLLPTGGWRSYSSMIPCGKSSRNRPYVPGTVTGVPLERRAVGQRNDRFGWRRGKLLMAGKMRVRFLARPGGRMKFPAPRGERV